MKKNSFRILIALFAIVFCFSIVGCKQKHKHKLSHYESVEATCATEGNIEHWKCTTCSKYFSDKDGKNEIISITINKKEHTTSEWIIDKEAGQRYKECTECKEKLVEESINALEHELKHYEKKEATCTTEGNIEYWKCTTCGKCFSDKDGKNEIISITINKKEHTTSEWIIDKEATCIEVGHRYKECTVCKEKLVKESINALGHELKHYRKKGATCATEGNIEHWKCTTCSKCFSDKDGKNEIISITINKKEHTISEWIIDKEATCIEVGHRYKECTVCKEIFAEEIIKTIEHDLKHYEKKEATCTTEGNIEYWKCTTCGKCFSDKDGKNEIISITISKKEHTIIAWIIDKKATCTEEGHRYKKCTVCKEKIVEETINVLGHDLKHYDKLEATCEEPGHEAYYECTRCDFITTYKKIEATGHKISEWITDKGATCESAGHRHKECTICKKVLEEENIKQTGHNLIHYEGKEQTFTEDGYKEYDVCTNCDYTTYKKIEATGIFELNENKQSWKLVGIKDTTAKKIVVPSTYNGLPVVSINLGVFSECSNLTSITLPYLGEKLNGTSNTHFGYIFGASVYSYNSRYVPTTLKEVIITGGTSITSFAFYGCSNLTNIIIPDSVTSIGKSAFYGCSNLTSITIPFVGESLNETSNTHFGYIFGASVYSDNSRYVPTTLKEVIITGGTSIGYYAFYGCNLTSITIPFVGESLNETSNTHFGYIFGASGFRDNSRYVPTTLKEVIITGGTSIGYYAFYGCSNLTNIIIPDSVTSIGKSAFYGCSNLTSIIVDKNNKVYDSREDCNAIIETSSNTLIAGCRNTVIPNSVTIIGDYAFDGCNNLTSITIPNSVIIIGNFAFRDCSNLTNIIIPNSVTSIGNNAFYNCSRLTSITIPNSVISIESEAFRDCSRLTSITIPDSVTWIGEYAFYNCTSLTKVIFENPYGWNVKISPAELSNASTAAKYLTDTYIARNWKRS